MSNLFVRLMGFFIFLLGLCVVFIDIVTIQQGKGELTVLHGLIKICDTDGLPYWLATIWWLLPMLVGFIIMIFPWQRTPPRPPPPRGRN